jgi:type IV secretory pathway protease TraF
VVVVRRPERLVIKRVRRSFADGSVWVAGDNPSASDDSRLYGPVPVADVVGRVLCRYWRGNTPRS